MSYRRTEQVVRKLAARHDAIMAAARELAAGAGLGSVQIARVAERAGIAVGTVYRYFPAKVDLISALAAAQAEVETAALDRAADAAPGPLSALAAAIATFAGRAASNRRLAFALMAEPVEAELEPVRARFRETMAEAFAQRIGRAIASGHLGDQDAGLAAAALVGAVIEGLIGPLARSAPDDPPALHTRAQLLTLFVLRGLGIADARARGLVVQVTLPLPEGAKLERPV